MWPAFVRLWYGPSIWIFFAAEIGKYTGTWKLFVYYKTVDDFVNGDSKYMEAKKNVMHSGGEQAARKA